MREEDGENIAISHFVSYSDGAAGYVTCTASVGCLDLPVLYDVATGRCIFGSKYLLDGIPIHQVERIRQTASRTMRDLLHTLNALESVS